MVDVKLAHLTLTCGHTVTAPTVGGVRVWCRTCMAPVDVDVPRAV